MLLKYRIYLFALFAAFIWAELANARGTQQSDSLFSKLDTLALNKDSLDAKADSASSDTTQVKKKKKDDFKSKVTYTAKDSVSYSKDYSKFYLYGDAKVNYEDIELTADYVEYDLPKNMVFASGLKDSTGKLIGKPVFKKGKESFKSETLYYNFKSKKGMIFNIVAEEEGGFLHAERTKKLGDGTIYLKNGEYTTCNAEHPHFYLALTKGIVIPNKKIVSGPAYLVLEDVPLPIAIPFGFFPNKHGATSGILMPTFGQSNNRGFSLTGGGYYLAISKYFDLAVTGDVYSKGTWGVQASSKYVQKYQFNGGFNFTYTLNVSGIKGIQEPTSADYYRTSKNMSIRWSHNADAKSNPNSRLTASVDYSTTKNDQYNNFTNPQLLISTNKRSSISYNRSWKNFNLTTNLGHSQNNQTRVIQFTLPNMSLSPTKGIYIFKRKDASGEKKWYDDIKINYNAQLSNQLVGDDSTILSKDWNHHAWKTKTFGFQHTIPLSTNFKVLKYFNITPSINYTGNLYTMKIHKDTASYIDTTTQKRVYYVRTDTIQGLTYAQGFAPTIGVSFNPTLYGTLALGKITKIRHVLTPTIGFSFIPGLKNLVQNYSRTIEADTAKKIQRQTYSIYDNNNYRTPTSSATHSGSLSFDVGNNLEMKVKSAKDTVTGTKKIVLIQSFSLHSSYNIYGETLSQKWSTISMSGTTPLPLAKNVNITYNGTLNEFDYDSTGRQLNQFYWTKHKKIGWLSNGSLGFGYTFTGGKKQSGTDDKQGTQQADKGNKKAEPKKKKGDFDYFKIPWSFQFNYTLNYSKQTPYKKSQVTQNLGFSGNFNITSKWKVDFSSAYDFQRKQISYTATQFSINRDLHCMVMSLNVAPFGASRYYYFKIAVLSQFLSDLKYDQRKYYYDYPNYSGF